MSSSSSGMSHCSWILTWSNIEFQIYDVYCFFWKAQKPASYFLPWFCFFLLLCFDLLYWPHYLPVLLLPQRLCCLPSSSKRNSRLRRGWKTGSHWIRGWKRGSHQIRGWNSGLHIRWTEVARGWGDWGWNQWDFTDLPKITWGWPSPWWSCPDLIPGRGEM